MKYFIFLIYLNRHAFNKELSKMMLSYVSNSNNKVGLNILTTTDLKWCLKNTERMRINNFPAFIKKILIPRELTTCRKRFRTSVDNFCVYLYAFFKPSQKHGLQAFICAMLKSSMPNLRSLSESKIMLAHCIRDVISCFSYPLSCISP